MLAHETYGEKGQPKLLLVHGLFGSGRNWRAIAKRLSSDFQVTTVDMRNHAGSFWSDEMNYPAMAQDLEGVIERLGAPVMVMGHSMGGKAAMVLALSRPELVERLIIADIAPVHYTHSHSHFIEAMQAMDLSQIQKRSDVGEALSQSVDEPALRAFFAQSVEITPQGARWMLNLEVLKASMDDILSFPDVSGSYDKRTLFVGGAQSDYINDNAREIIKPLFPNARFAKLKNAGHWLHADQPKAFIQTLQVFCKA